LRYFLFVFTLFIALNAVQMAQAAEKALLNGRVVDSSGAAVPAASVILHQISGSVVIRTQTDESGVFLFSEIPAGQYLISAVAKGLATEQAADLTLAPGDSKSVALTLVVSSTVAQVTVTAAGVPQSVDEISKALDVVSTAGAERRGLFLISDALRFVPGLRVTTRGGPGSYTEIETRGLPYQDTAVLLDGSPLRDPTSPQDEASALLSELLLVNTSGIEVLRGSGSSLYGTNAVSGTVNLLTAGGGGAFHGDIDLQGGGLGLFEGVARGSGGAFDNRLTYSAAVANLNETRGVDDVGAARDWSGQGGLRYEITPQIHAAVDLLGATSYAQTSVTPAALSSATGIIPAIPVPSSQLKLADQGLDYNPGNATFLPSLGDPDAGVYGHFLDSLFRFDQQVSPHLNYRIAYSLLTTDRNNTDGPGGPATPNYFPPAFSTSDRYDGRVDTLNAAAHYLLGSRQIITAGYEFVHEHYLELSTDQNPDPTQRIYERTEAEQRFQSGYAQDEIRLLNNRLAILLSGRITSVGLDQPSFVGGASPYGNVALPKPPSAYTGDASIAYFVAATGTKVRAHVGNSFRMPSLYERFGGYFFGGEFFPLGDPGLSPERAISVDGGFDQYLFHERLKISATYFYAHLQEVIGYELFPPDYVDPYGRPDGYYNTGGGISRGVELSGEVHPARNTRINASYTYTNTLNRMSQFYTGTGIDPLQTPRILPNQVKIVATQDLGKHVDLAMDFDGGSSFLFPLFGANFSASTTYRFDGPRQLGVAAGYTQPLGEHRSLRFYTRVSNALGQNYYEDGFRTPGRWAVAGIHFAF
jgi:iron complex outermembrane receptor protein